jgi:CubicO group peptidase (beta-lactamase class C family)
MMRSDNRRLTDFDRRRFLQQMTAVGLGCAGVGPRLAQSQESKMLPVTGKANAELASFDRLMESFVEKHKIPGAALAVSWQGRLVYARGFGFADVEKKEPVEPAALFRIASISKPITAVAVMQLVEQGKLRLDDKILDHLKLPPHLEGDARVDPRWKEITLRYLLQHRGGWDRSVSFDPIGRVWEIADALKVGPPTTPEHIIRYMLGKPLDFDPGQRYAYSNLGYLLLGRAIESVAHQPYVDYIHQHVLGPLDIRDMQLGRALLENRAKGEVKYYDAKHRTGRAVVGSQIGETVPVQYGAENLEGYEAHGGWIASAVDLVRFATAFDDPRPASLSKRPPLLKPETIATMWARPDGAPGFTEEGKPRPTYYACGWNVRPVGKEGKLNAWHTGSISGTSTLLVRRWDGLDWSVLFNTDRDSDGKAPSGVIDPLIHDAAGEVQTWPEVDLFGEYLPAKP